MTAVGGEKSRGVDLEPELSIVDGSTGLSEPKRLDGSTWMQEPSSLDGLTWMLEPRSRVVDLASGADTFRG